MSGSVYKIRDRNTGLFSKGGYYAFFSKAGKSWSRLGGLKRALTLYRDGGCCRDGQIPDSWEIVEYREVAEPISASHFAFITR